MSDFLERLTGLIHWVGFLITLWVAYMYLTEPTNIDLWFQIFATLLPNTCGWLVKYIFTGNNNFFPW